MIKLTFNRTAFTASASMSDFYNEVGVASYMEYGTVALVSSIVSSSTTPLVSSIPTTVMQATRGTSLRR